MVGGCLGTSAQPWQLSAVESHRGKWGMLGAGGFGRQNISDSQRAVMNGSGITGHQQLGGRWSPDPLWQPATLARPLPHSPRPPPVTSTCGKVGVASVTLKRLFSWGDVFMGEHLVWSHTNRETSTHFKVIFDGACRKKLKTVQYLKTFRQNLWFWFCANLRSHHQL